MAPRFYYGLAIVIAASAFSCGPSTIAADTPQNANAPARVRSEAPNRPADWATPIPGKPGLPNLHKVADGLYRGAQPEAEGFAQLKALGIKTVVNLRTLHSDRDECRKVGLDYVHITAQPWEAEEDEVVAFLEVVTDPKRQPVFVHCQHGADRTGMMCAVYRIVLQGWPKDAAIKEMTDGGFGFHAVWQNLVKYVRELDVEKIKGRM
ncbi:MAG TPA: dual specificity protein phosphatase family protein [Thermoguttaceae bacterium]|nr:dual specificity protein phosphatase family protein [Thermoguttaceae bacterium]